MEKPRESAVPVGLTMPAEWETQAAVWLTWPLNEGTWPGKLSVVRAAVARIAAAVTQRQVCRIVCVASAQDAARGVLAEAGAEQERVCFTDARSDDVWCRDHGPTFLVNRAGGPGAAVAWRFNAWGGKFPHEWDARLGRVIAAEAGVDCVSSDLVCEGGGLESNGAGYLLTTESVLLNPNRNPEWSRRQVETELCQKLGMREVAWLPAGMATDDTDGHVDTLARFFREDGIVAALETDSRSPDYRALQVNREVLEGLRTPGGGRFDLVWLPQPEPCLVEGWRVERLPASYANFLLINGAVLVPTYRQPKSDARALGILGELFQGREVLGIDCLDIVQEGGAIHCLTQQQPA